MTNSAPIAVFAYARADHLKRTLEKLVRNDGFDTSHVTVFIDGPRRPEEASAVEAVAEVARDVLGNSTEIRRAPQNLGLAKSITSGVSELVERHGRVIVVEDDLETSPVFLTYMNAALERYALDERVFHVSGYAFDVHELRGTGEAVMFPLTSTWGWATWARAWRHYDAEATGWHALRSDRALRRRFDLEGNYPYTMMMERFARGKVNSWGIRWYWSVFKAQGLGVFPPETLVHNIGQDGSGTHGRGILTDFAGEASSLPAEIPHLPEMAQVDPVKYDALCRTIWRQNGGWRGWILNKIRSGG